MLHVRYTDIPFLSLGSKIETSLGARATVPLHEAREAKRNGETEKLRILILEQSFTTHNHLVNISLTCQKRRNTVRIQDHRYKILLGMLLLDIRFIWPESYLPCRPVSCMTHCKKESSLFRLFKNHGPEKWCSSRWLFPFIFSLTRWTSSIEAWSLELDPNLRVSCAVTNSSKSYNHSFWSFQGWATGSVGHSRIGLSHKTCQSLQKRGKITIN